MKGLFLFILTVFITAGSTEIINAKPLPTNNRLISIVRDFVHSHLSSWNKRIAVATMVAALFAPSPIQAQDVEPQEIAKEERLWHEIDDERYFSVLHLVLDFLDARRNSHIVYLGNDHKKRAFFLALRLSILDIPHVQGKPLLGAADVYLADHKGLVLENAEVEEVRAFIGPDKSEGRLYDITLLAVEGLDTSAYQPLQLAVFPSPGTELDLVSYHVPLDNHDDWRVMFDASLLKQECRAGIFAPNLWGAGSNCILDTLGAGATAPVFADGYLVGFGLIERTLVGIPPGVLVDVSDALSVDPKQKLSVIWGETKRGER